MPIDTDLRRHLRRTIWFCLAIVACIFGEPFLWSWAGGIAFMLLMLVSLPSAIAALIWTIVLTVRGIMLVRRPRPILLQAVAILAAPVLASATCASAPFVRDAGSFAGYWTKLMANRSRYEAVVARVAASGIASGRHEIHGLALAVDRGPPVRVAFDPRGMLDNWTAIVFDPTGAVMSADGFDASGRFAAGPETTGLFGGDLVHCMPLSDDFYVCSFT